MLWQNSKIKSSVYILKMSGNNSYKNNTGKSMSRLKSRIICLEYFATFALPNRSSWYAYYS